MTTTEPAALPAPRGDWALFLDVDGTVVDIVDEPTQARVERSLLGPLMRIETALRGALALVSGRPIANLDALFAPHRFAAAGQHGAEWRRHANGTMEALPDGAFDADLAQHIGVLAMQWPDILVETKSSCVALHFRRDPRLGPVIRDALTPLLQLQAPHYELLAGKMVWEVRRSGVDKGKAVAILMENEPFKGRTPVFIGDDRTDEDAMAEVKQRGGHALAVGDLNPQRWGRAFHDATDVRAWLIAVADRLGANS